MAQWWELAIPATITLVGTLSAGLLGAGYQRRSSERLIRIQAEEDAKIRKEQAEEASKTRRFEVAKERQLQSYKDRHQAYSNFITKPREIATLEGQAKSLRQGMDREAATGSADVESRERRLSQLVELFSKLEAANRGLIEAYDLILFLGSPRVISIAQILSRARAEKAGSRAISSLETTFIHAANRDLNVSVREDVDKEPSYGDMILHLYDTYGTDPLKRRDPASPPVPADGDGTEPDGQRV